MTANNPNSASITTEYMDITPDLAAKWLEGNVLNRPVSQARVNKLAAEMKAGRWRTTHQGLAFDADGTLVDGQHRLWAIFMTGCTLHMAVTHGLSRSDIEFIDGGGRSIGDRISITGKCGPERINRNHLATLHEMVRGLNSTGRLTYQQEVDLMTRHVEAVRYANSHLATRTPGVSVACVRAVIARAWYSVDREKLGRFCRVLSTGRADSANDAVIVKLREHLMASQSGQNAAVRRELYGMVEWVLTTWLKGETQSLLRPVAQEFFPLPEDLPSPVNG